MGRVEGGQGDHPPWCCFTLFLRLPCPSLCCAAVFVQVVLSLLLSHAIGSSVTIYEGMGMGCGGRCVERFGTYFRRSCSRIRFFHERWRQSTAKCQHEASLFPLTHAYSFSRVAPGAARNRSVGSTSSGGSGCQKVTGNTGATAMLKRCLSPKFPQYTFKSRKQLKSHQTKLVVLPQQLCTVAIFIVLSAVLFWFSIRYANEGERLEEGHLHRRKTRGRSKTLKYKMFGAETLARGDIQQAGERPLYSLPT